jgi:predicted metal-dependent hydrolase
VRLHSLKGLIIVYAALRTEAGPQIVQEVRNDHEEDRLALLEAIIGDGAGQMGLATAIRPIENQPSLWGLSEAPSHLKGTSQVLSLILREIHAFGIEGLEGHMAEQLLSKAAQLLEDRWSPLLYNTDLREIRVADSRIQALIQLVQRGIHCYDGGLPSVEPVIDDLEELLLSPGRAALRPQVIKDQQGSPTYLLEELIVRHFTGRTETPAQMIEQIRYDDEEGRSIIGDAQIGYGCREMGLATARRAHQYQPSLRILSEGLGDL